VPKEADRSTSGQVGPSGAPKFRDVRVQKDMQSAVSLYKFMPTPAAPIYLTLPIFGSNGSDASVTYADLPKLAAAASAYLLHPPFNSLSISAVRIIPTAEAY
jgi:hypothetical protein